MSDDNENSLHATARRVLRPNVGRLICCLVFLAPLAIGTVHWHTRLLLFLGCAVALAITLLERNWAVRRLPVTVPAFVLLAAVVISALQLIPLPRPLLSILSPRTHEMLSTVLDSYALHSVTVNPRGTFAEVTKLLALAAFLVAATTFASKPDRRRMLVMSVAGVAGLCAGLGLLQTALQEPTLLFFYTPSTAWAGFVRGSFVNPNHFGALMCLGAPCALLIAFAEPRRRAFALPAVVLINVGLLFSLSRSAVAAGIVGQVAALVLFWRAQARRRLPRGSASRAPHLPIMAVLAALIIALCFGATRMAHMFQSTSVAELSAPASKVKAWGDAVGLILDHPLTGVGRGGFEHAFTRYSQAAGTVRFPFIENEYLQTLADWGFPAGAFILLLVIWSAAVAVLAVRRNASDPVLISALCGLLALALQELGDFAIQLPGVAIPALALVAVLFGRRDAEPERGVWRVTAARVLFLAPAVLVLCALGDAIFDTADKRTTRFAAQAADPRVSDEAIRQEGARLQRLAPSDHVPPVILGERLVRAGHGDALRVLNVAMYLNPKQATPHVLAARALAGRKKTAQALLEFKAATRLAPDPRDQVWPSLLARFPAADAFLRAIPDEPHFLHMFGEWLRTSRSDHQSAERVYRRLLEHDPKDALALAILAQTALAKSQGVDAVTLAQRALAVSNTPDVKRLLVRALMAKPDLEGAQRVLDAGIDRTPATMEVEAELALALAKRGLAVRARGRLDRIETSWPLERSAMVRLHEVRAEVERHAGNEHLSKWELERRAILNDTDVR